MSTISDEPTNTFPEKWPNYSLFKETIIYYVKSELNAKKNKKTPPKLLFSVA